MSDEEEIERRVRSAVKKEMDEKEKRDSSNNYRLGAIISAIIYLAGAIYLFIIKEYNFGILSAVLLLGELIFIFKKDYKTIDKVFIVIISLCAIGFFGYTGVFIIF